MKDCGIYKIKNCLDGKCYIGSAKSISKRWKRHLYDLGRGKHHSVYLQRSWTKHGAVNFSFEILEITDRLFERELFWINALKPVYNLGSVGGGDNISKHPRIAEIRKRKQEIGKENWLNPAYRAKQMERLKGPGNPNWKGGICAPICLDCKVPISPYKKRCMVCSKLGKQNPFFGKSHSETTKAVLRDMMKGKKPTNAKMLTINGREFKSQADAARAFNVSNGTISNWVRGKTKIDKVVILPSPS